MADRIDERVWDKEYHSQLTVTEADDGLELTAIEGGRSLNAAALTLDADGVKKLRLILARYERKQK